MNGLFIYLENKLDIEKLKKCKVKIPDFSINEFNELFKRIHFKDCGEVFNYVNNLKAVSKQNENLIRKVKKCVRQLKSVAKGPRKSEHLPALRNIVGDLLLTYRCPGRALLLTLTVPN